MIHFYLNIEKFYESELANGSEIKAIACIEYPIIHIIAKTVETMEEEYDELDRFIVQSASKHNGFTVQQFSELTGLNFSVFEYRAEELVKQQYITFENGTIVPIEKGFEFLNDPQFEREIEKTRSFILDGVSHEPLRSYFYKEGKENLISEDERDTWGNKLFNPAIIHNPPTKNIKQQIIDIPVEERLKFSIPVGLKEIKDYDFALMTYPIPIVLSTTEDGEISKRIIDGFTLNLNADDLVIWQEKLNEEIGKTEIVIEEKDKDRNSLNSKRIQFKSNWGNSTAIFNERIFNITKDKLKHFLQRLYGLQSIDEGNILLNDYEIKICIDKKVFETEGTDRKKLIESCLRGRDYYRQYEGTGVWLVFLKIVISDDFINGLCDLYRLLQEEILLTDLLSHYHNNYRVLRQNLIAIERFEKLEELDIYLFLHSRETNFNQNYLTMTND